MVVQAPYHEALLGAWFDLVGGAYRSSSYTSSEEGVGEAEARDRAR